MGRASRVDTVMVTQRFRSRSRRLDDGEAETVELPASALVRCIGCRQTVTVGKAIKLDNAGRWACRRCITQRMTTDD